MSVEYKTVLYQPGDELEIVPLLNLAYGNWPFFDIGCSPMDHWRWRYLDFPHPRNIIGEIFHEGKIIATNHNILHYMIINGKRYLASYGTDACVNPRFQGRGLYRVLASSAFNRRKKAGVKFGYMVTVNHKVLNSKTQRKSTPYRFPHKVKYLSRITDINKHIEMKNPKNEYRTKIKHYMEQFRTLSTRLPNPEIEISQVTKFPQTTEGFLKQVNESYDFIKHRTRDYLNWRYLDPRGGNYNVRMVVENGEMIGYGVFRINKLEKYHVGYIVDLLTYPDRLDTAEALLLDSLCFFRDNLVNQVIYQVVERHPFESLANKYGFYGGEANRHIFYNYLGYDDLMLEKIPPGKFHFPFGDLTAI